MAASGTQSGEGQGARGLGQNAPQDFWKTDSEEQGSELGFGQVERRRAERRAYRPSLCHQRGRKELSPYHLLAPQMLGDLGTAHVSQMG